MEEQTLTIPTGTARYWSPAPGVFASRVTGFLNLEAGKAYMAYGDAVLSERKPGIGVHDWHGLTGYEKGTRQLVTAWAVRVLADFEEIYIYSDSRIVRMGLSVANIALRGRVIVPDSREEVERIYAEVVERRSAAS